MSAEPIDLSQGHADPSTMPPALFAYPPATWGYVAAAYLAGVEVGRRQPAPTTDAGLPAEQEQQ